MPKISVIGVSSVEKRFHDEDITVYPKNLPLSEISFWKENNRTTFTFERLEIILNKPLIDISIEEITDFVARDDLHKLEDLATSIKNKGVQVPLIVLDDGTLLDGNRRFFACQYIKMQCNKANKPLPDFLNQIPSWIIKATDISKRTRLKIIAEHNFIKDLQLPWSLDAQSRAIDAYFQELHVEQGVAFEDALPEIISVFGITKARARDLWETLNITKEFIKSGSTPNEKLKRHHIAEERFVYFWELRNKAMKGNGKYKDETQLNEVKTTFFKLMAMGQNSPIKNVKQVEPLVQARRDKTAWAMLNEDNGAKLAVVVSMVRDRKEHRKAEDKIRAFSSWLEDVDDLSKSSFDNLQKLSKIILTKTIN